MIHARWKTIYILLALTVLLHASDDVVSDIDDINLLSPRAVGRGSTGVALVHEPDALWYNPALIDTKKPQGYYAGYSYMEDVYASRFACSVPLGSVALGIGYKGLAVRDIDIISLDAINPIDQRPAPGMIDSTAFKQETIAFGLAYTLLKDELQQTRLAVGLSYKLFSARTTNNDGVLHDAYGQGSDLDLGFYYKALPTWHIGLNARNIITKSGGSIGGFVWGTGTTEIIPAQYVLGNVFTSDDDGMRYLLDVSFTEKGYIPNLISTGVDVRLTQYFRLRGGYHQYPIPTSSGYKVNGAVAGGFSVIPLKDFNIDYAYYPGDDLGANAVHYAGLSIDSFDGFIPSRSAQGSQPKEKRVTAPVIEKKLVYKPLTYAELQKQGQTMDVDKVVYTPEYQRETFPDDVLTVATIAEYITESFKISVPREFQGVFTATDILVLNKYMSEDVLQRESLTRGEFAVILARIEGYDYLVAGDDAVEKAIDALTATTYYSGADFSPADAPITRRQVIGLLAKTSALYRHAAVDPAPRHWLHVVVDKVKRSAVVQVCTRQPQFVRQISIAQSGQQIKVEANVPTLIALNDSENRISINVVNESGDQQVYPYVLGKPERLQDRAELLMIKAVPHQVYPGQQVRFEFGVPAEMTFDSVVVSSSLLEEPLPLILDREQVWATTVSLPENVDPGMYEFSFVAKIGVDTVVKKHVLQVMGKVSKAPEPIKPKVSVIVKPKIASASVVVEAKSVPSVEAKIASLTDSQVITKVAPLSPVAGNEITVYAGVMPEYKGQVVVQFVFADGIQLTGQQVSAVLWKAVRKAVKGRQTYKVYVKDVKGARISTTGVYIAKSVTPVLKPVAVEKPVAVIKPTASVTVAPKVVTPAPVVTPITKPVVKKTEYIIEPSFSVKVPLAGSLLGCTVKTDSEIKKVVVELNNKEKIALPYVAVKGVWYEKVLIPKAYKGKTITLKIYVKDAQGKYSTYQKELNVI